MLIEARTISNGTHIKADLCIVGAGAAGITLARELRSLPIDICILESGNLGYEPETQFLCEGENVGVEYWPLSATRIRFFGGTTNHWGGVCLPLEEDDFEPRQWVEGSGWPFRKKDLEPYYRRAHKVFDIGPYAYEASDWLPEQSPPFPLDPARVSTAVAQVSRARFGVKYRDELRAAENVKIYLHANVVDIDTSTTADHVTRLQVACLEGPRFSVSARIYVLAMGGIENARILLLSNRVQKNGLGNQNDLVGRYFSDHPYIGRLATLTISDPKVSTAAYTEREGDIRLKGIQLATFLRLTPEMRRTEHLLSSRFYVQPIEWAQLSRGTRTVDRLRQNVSQGKLRVNKHLAGDLLRIVRDIDGVAMAAYQKSNGGRLFRIGGWTETIPNKNSRVRLGDRLDALGQRQVVLDWRIGQQEKESFIRTLEIIGSEIGRAGIGRLRLEFTPESQVSWDQKTNSVPHPGFHHMGTTRMQENPRHGVVDANSKLHGVTNLFVAGSSVFPSYGHSNPTLTIGALSLRLADHLKLVLAGARA